MAQQGQDSTPQDGGQPTPQGQTQLWLAGQERQPDQRDSAPGDLVIEDENSAEQEADGQPSAEGMHEIRGYENVGNFGQAVDMAPPPALPPPSGEPPPMEILDVPNLTEEQCREALLTWVAEHCCYGKGCAKDMQISKVTPSTALHYTLETFCEGRSTGRAYSPYPGGFVDGPQNGMPPPPWDIACEPDSQFQNHTKILEVPHTSQVQTCHKCTGLGVVRCLRCHGRGQVRCGRCGGDGRIRRNDPKGGSKQVRCSSCGGDGRRRCRTCGGDGRVRCRVCTGFGQIRCFIELTVTFNNHVSDHILEKTDMPDELVRDVGGVLLFEQTLPQVWPLSAYPVQEISQNSIRLVDTHRSAFRNERQLNQRQTLRAVAVTEVAYKWKDLDTRFWVYGMEAKVHAPDYPQTCCWGCTIL